MDLERVLFFEDQEYYEEVQWQSEAVKDEMMMRKSYTDSFQFIFPLFQAYTTNHPCSNKPSEIHALVDQIAKQTLLRQISNKTYLSTLDVFSDTYTLILATIDSIQRSQKPKEVPVLIVENFSTHEDSCTVTMTPVLSMVIPDSAQVYKYDQRLNITAVPFTYEGSVNGLRCITKDGERYGKR